MTPVKTQFLTFAEYLDTSPEDGRYELVNGKLMKMDPTRGHEDVVEFLDRRFYDEVRRLKLNYVIKQNIAIRTETATGIEQGRRPDLCVIEKEVWKSDPTAYAALVQPFPLVVEVVSSNWKTDYIDKFDEYQRLGISEYWIVDDAMMATFEYLGNPKVPTVWVYRLKDDRYEGDRFTGGDRVVSPLFPELDLTVDEIVESRFS